MAGMEDRGSLFADLQDKKAVTEKYLVRHFLGVKQFLENGEPDCPA